MYIGFFSWVSLVIPPSIRYCLFDLQSEVLFPLLDLMVGFSYIEEPQTNNVNIFSVNQHHDWHIEHGS